MVSLFIELCKAKSASEISTACITCKTSQKGLGKGLKARTPYDIKEALNNSCIVTSMNKNDIP